MGESNNIGVNTAELPAWIARTGSSFQGRTVPEKTEEWFGYWESVRPSLDGCGVRAAKLDDIWSDTLFRDILMIWCKSSFLMSLMLNRFGKERG
ncbi:MAG: hypothetical protein KAR40_09380 [Candidatus Sabulitectum sp.]|nr:hypothetical protein [Candidatus Sabulitectum sp.]